MEVAMLSINIFERLVRIFTAWDSFERFAFIFVVALRPRNYQPMQIILEGADEHEIACVYCHWQGNTSDLTKGDYFVLTNITELHCPRCNKYLGFIQHDSPQNDKNNPGVS